MKNQKTVSALMVMLFIAFTSYAKNENQFNKDITNYSEVTSIMDAYLSIKEALVSDDQKKASEYGEVLATAASEFDVKKYPNTEVNEILEVIQEHGEHIAKSEISHQREHFAELAQELKDLVQIVGTDRTLYAQYCPMYNNNKGGSWLSVSEDIKNPYYGNKMLKCGSVKEVIEKD